MSNIMDGNKKIEISTGILKKILDHSPNEIYVLDKDARIVYMNKNCKMHYGLKLNEVIGESNDQMVAAGYWKPSILPFIFKEKKPVTLKQETYSGKELITIGIPILNKKREIELIVFTGQEPTYKNIQLPLHEKEQHSNESNLYQAKIITNNEKVKNIMKFCEKIAPTNTTVLIQGESGTGKGVLANYIHQKSARKSGPFLTINCAAIPEELLESELFGYTKGAFTGANTTGKKGLFEIANGGTIFMDEIGEIPLKIQAKLLQVIQERQFVPIGGEEVKKVDVRIIAATNQSLYEMMKNKEFREDLYYRLNVIDIKVLPLRERREDITLLTYYFLNQFNERYEVNKLISEEVLVTFQNYSWPGNIRQLENMMERLVVTSDFIIQVSDLPEVIIDHQNEVSSPSGKVSLEDSLENLERTLVINSFRKCRTTREVAEDLSITQSKAARLIRKHCKENF